MDPAPPPPNFLQPRLQRDPEFAPHPIAAPQSGIDLPPPSSNGEGLGIMGGGVLPVFLRWFSGTQFNSL